MFEILKYNLFFTLLLLLFILAHERKNWNEHKGFNEAYRSIDAMDKPWMLFDFWLLLLTLKKKLIDIDYQDDYFLFIPLLFPCSSPVATLWYHPVKQN
jgi:hypothetical protein